MIKRILTSKRVIILFLTTLFGNFFSGFSSLHSRGDQMDIHTDLASVQSLSAQELKDKIASNPALIVINVLPKEAYNDCHIAGSINIPLENLEDRVKRWTRDTEIVVYCASQQCPLSREAYKTLAELGFTNIYAYEGGIEEWKAKSFSCEGSCTMDNK
jgi:rhodanese-related sulfurtransferase